MDDPALAPYILGWRRRDEANRARGAARAARARAQLAEVVRLLVSRFGVERVVLFGSLAEGRFEESSDIDLAVSGLGERWFEAWAAAEDAVGPEFRIDLVPIERARPAIRRAIEEGEVLFERR